MSNIPYKSPSSKIARDGPRQTVNRSKRLANSANYGSLFLIGLKIWKKNREMNAQHSDWGTLQPYQPWIENGKDKAKYQISVTTVLAHKDQHEIGNEMN
jgi:hypothetical protein